MSVPKRFKRKSQILKVTYKPINFVKKNIINKLDKDIIIVTNLNKLL